MTGSFGGWELGLRVGMLDMGWLARLLSCDNDGLKRGGRLFVMCGDVGYALRRRGV